MIFATRQLQEKCQEMRTHLYSTFVDLTKAFDTVNREGLWKIMQKFGCPERFIQMVRQLHDGMMARVTDNGAVSEAFAVTNGVKQGCVLASLQSTADALPIACIHIHRSRTSLRRRLRPQHHLGSGHAKEHGPLLRRLRGLRSDHQHGGDDDHALTATQYSPSPQCAEDQRERNPTASGGQLPVSGQYPFLQHQNRRRSILPGFKGQLRLYPPLKHSLESSRSPAQQKVEGVKGRHPPDAVARS
nr:unnamed protein product [Spirometra erinaceieuropaei]